MRAALTGAPAVRRATAANLARILNRAPTRRERARFARAVLGSFYDVVADLGRLRGATASDLRARVVGVEGEDAYRAARARKKGAVIVTAHVGSFEAGLAALAGAEPAVHVVFKRDEFPAFERIRSGLRRALNVREAPIDDGWPTLLQLRAALLADEVVVLQGDRAYPGQRRAPMRVLGGTLALPTGPAALARLAGSPLVPTFALRELDGRFRVQLHPPVWPDAGEGAALRAFADALADVLRARPEQWLVLHEAFIEDGAIVGRDG